MPMRDLNVKKAQKLLSRIMEFELAGVVRYTHYSLMVAGPNRIPIVAFMKAQASESLLHAQQAGEILTGLGGHPTLQIAPIPESYKHSVKDILEESLAHERDALDLYREFLDEVEDRSVYLEEFARTQIAQEEMHGLEVRKMLRDVAATDHPEAAVGHDVDEKRKKKDKKRHKKKRKEKDGRPDESEGQAEA
jgi:bacterioferritin